ncbi:hypothetical protein FUA48_16660 [Flavobacterium alkalisoli]|uniref:WG repeat-containing protein n=1 Tax=Flavobacterium alkalisoli TaxID=2602769 RepID=A0A5B9G117_9FLAO|nr:hypothetical protein [Flavobacterium alkalisoli]QEE51142.1 hypothetical protein FUA48_16660 [Flavobacterium alkalisoli]
MMLKKIIIVFSLFVSAEASYAQQSNGYMDGFFLDYVITKDGDTIYGAVKEELFKAYILKISNDGTGSYTRYEADNLKGYRYNGYVTINKEPKDGIYTGLKAKKDSLDSAQNDYIVKNNDTIYGDVHEPLLGSRYIIPKQGKKIKFKGEVGLVYKRGQYIYEYRDKPKVETLDSKEDWLLLLYKGKGLKLYGYATGHQGTCYFIEKDKEMHLLRMDEDWLDLLNKLFADKPDVLKCFKSGFLSFENIYLAVRYYDEHSN